MPRCTGRVNSPRLISAPPIAGPRGACALADGTTHNEEIIVVEVVPPPYQHGGRTDRRNETRRGSGIQSDGPQLLHNSLGANLEKFLGGASNRFSKVCQLRP